MAFNIPVQNTLANLRPSSPPTPWTRQPDWVPITSVPDTEVYFLVNDATNLLYKLQTSYTGVGNLTIDWGDASPPDVITSGVSTFTSHTYIAGTGTPCSLGYDTWKITITLDPGLSLTLCNFVNPGTSPSGNYTVGLLEAWFGSGHSDLVLTDFGNTTNSIYLTYLEYIKCPTTASHAGIPIIMFNAYSLAKVDYYTSLPYTTSQQNAFSGCNALQELTFPADMVNCTTFSNTFNGNYSLYTVTFPSTCNFTTSMNQTFVSCSSLAKVEIPSMPLCTDWAQCFNGCSQLLNFRFQGLLSSAGTVSFSSTFLNCKSLQSVTFPTTVTAGVILNLLTTFSTCEGLMSVTLPSNADISTLESTFTGCRSLQEVSLPSNTPSLSSFASTFTDCANLQNITLPTTVGASALPFTSTFSGTTGLTDVVIPSSYLLGSCVNMFLNSRVRSITLPNNVQNSLSSMATFASGCNNLEEVVLPTQMGTCTSFNATFQNCFRLKSVTLPTALPQVNTMSSCFLTNRNLESITFPTSMPALSTNGFNSTFSGCTSLKNVVLPATISSAYTTFSSAFTQCWSLETVTLPTTQTTSLVVGAFLNMFNNCPSLKTVINMDKLGNNAVGSTTYMTGTGMFGTTPSGRILLEGADFSCKFSSFAITGTAGEPLTQFTSLRLRNSGTGQYAGTAPQIDIKYTGLGQAALVQVFNDLPTVTGKTIDITGAAGAAALTAGERAIATGKGWTIIG